MNMEKLIQTKLQEKVEEKQKWLETKDSYDIEYEKEKDNQGTIREITMGMKNAIVLSQKCQNQINCCEEWIDFLIKLEMKKTII